MSIASKLFIVTAVVAGIVGCGGAPEEEGLELGEVQSGIEQLNGAVFVRPGFTACYPQVPANLSAAIAGTVSSLQGLTQPPLLLVNRAADYASPFSKIYEAPITPDGYGRFALTLNRRTGFGEYIPGLFEFCVQNPRVNSQTFSVTASVTAS
jgi:hypothetical protein